MGGGIRGGKPAERIERRSVPVRTERTGGEVANPGIGVLERPDESGPGFGDRDLPERGCRGGADAGCVAATRAAEPERRAFRR